MKIFPCVMHEHPVVLPTLNYGGDVIVGTLPDNVDPDDYVVLHGGPYRGPLGQHDTFGVICSSACQDCTAVPPCTVVPRLSPRTTPIYVRTALAHADHIGSHELNARILDPKDHKRMLGELSEIADKLGKVVFHTFAISAGKYKGKVIAIPIAPNVHQH